MARRRNCLERNTVNAHHIQITETQAEALREILFAFDELNRVPETPAEQIVLAPDLFPAVWATPEVEITARLVQNWLLGHIKTMKYAQRVSEKQWRAPVESHLIAKNIGVPTHHVRPLFDKYPFSNVRFERESVPDGWARKDGAKNTTWAVVTYD